jgi:hypothetical protein
MTLYAYEDAAHHYAGALEALARSGRATGIRRCELLIALGEAWSRGGDERQSKTALRRAASLAQDEGRPDLLARAALAYGGRIPWARGSTDPELVPLLERGLDAVGQQDDAMRVRLLAHLAAARRDDARRDRRFALADEAFDIADRLEDPGIEAVALETRLNGADGPDTVDAALAASRRLVELAERAGDREGAYNAHHYRMDAFWVRCDRAGVDLELETLGRLSGELRQPVQRWAFGAAETTLALLEGRLADAEQLVAGTFAIGDAAVTWNATVSQRMALLVLRREQGRIAELEDLFARSFHEYPTLLRFQCAYALLLADVGEADEASRVTSELVARDLALEHLDAEWLFSLCLLAEAAAETGQTDAAAALYPLLLPYRDLYALAPVEAVFGSVARALGVLATALGRFDEAVDHLAAAIDTERRMRATPWLAHAQRALAGALAARGDEYVARDLRAEAAGTYRRLGMASWAARVR